MGGLTKDVAALAQLLHETSVRHGSFEAVARRTTSGTGMRRTWTRASAGCTPDEASAAAGCYMTDVKDVVIAASPAI